jgi:hypothetical protein
VSCIYPWSYEDQERGVSYRPDLHVVKHLRKLFERVIKNVIIGAWKVSDNY